ncbi:SDR family oxidoreductase [Chamaesiphon sp.]|uniref:SDR family oxidoreductase n=1 Tax=Chamaesiphon sp. TaxID=2814140 RepID=UPI0035930E20
MVTNILVTGATGNVGREVVRLLSAQELPVTVAVRDPIGAAKSFGSNVRCVLFDFTNPDTFADAFRGIDKLFLVRPPAIADIHQITPALNAAKQAGVEEIIFLSIIGADRNHIVPHYAIERAIEKLNILAVFLRCSFFMQNLNTTHREDIRIRNRLFMPAGNGRTSFIDVRDIAAVAVKFLTEEPDRSKGAQINRAYDLTGTAALTYSEVATVFTNVLDRPIHYTNPSIPVFIWQMLQQGFSFQFVLVTIGIYTTARFGLASMVTSDVQQLLGRAPISMKQYVEDYRQCWLQASPTAIGQTLVSHPLIYPLSNLINT